MGEGPLAPGTRIEIRMDTDKSWIHFVRVATVIKVMEAPGGHLTVLRLERPLGYWHRFPRRLKHVAVQLEGPYYRTVEGRPEPVAGVVYGAIYGVKGLDPEKRDRRWPHFWRNDYFPRISSR